MHPDKIKVGSQFTLSDGSLVEVKQLSQDKLTVTVNYIDSMGEPELVGKDARVGIDDVIALFTGTHAEGAT